MNQHKKKSLILNQYFRRFRLIKAACGRMQFTASFKRSRQIRVMSLLCVMQMPQNEYLQMRRMQHMEWYEYWPTHNVNYDCKAIIHDNTLFPYIEMLETDSHQNQL